MIKAAMVGLGWRGQTLVEAVQGGSAEIRFVAGATGTRSPEVQDFAQAHGLVLHASYEELLQDANVQAVVQAQLA